MDEDKIVYDKDRFDFNHAIKPKPDFTVPPEFKEKLDKMWDDESSGVRPIKGVIGETELQANADLVSLFIVFELINRRNGLTAARRFIRGQKAIYREIKPFINLEVFRQQMNSGKLISYNNAGLIASFIQSFEGMK